jgi:hypothetical protein
MATDQTTLSRHSERSEESRMIPAGEHPAGFFAALRMTGFVHMPSSVFIRPIRGEKHA